MDDDEQDDKQSDCVVGECSRTETFLIGPQRAFKRTTSCSPVWGRSLIYGP